MFCSSVPRVVLRPSFMHTVCQDGGSSAALKRSAAVKVLNY